MAQVSIKGALQTLATNADTFVEALCILAAQSGIQTSVREAVQGSTLAIVPLDGQQILDLVDQVQTSTLSRTSTPDQRLTALVGSGVRGGCKQLRKISLEDVIVEIVMGPPNIVENYVKKGEVASTPEEAARILTIPQNFHEMLAILADDPGFLDNTREAMTNSAMAIRSLQGDELIEMCDRIQDRRNEQLANRISASPEPEIDPLPYFESHVGSGVYRCWRWVEDTLAGNRLEIVTGPTDIVRPYLSLAQLTDGNHFPYIASLLGKREDVQAAVQQAIEKSTVVILSHTGEQITTLMDQVGEVLRESAANKATDLPAAEFDPQSRFEELVGPGIVVDSIEIDSIGAGSIRPGPGELRIIMGSPDAVEDYKEKYVATTYPNVPSPPLEPIKGLIGGCNFI